MLVADGALAPFDGDLDDYRDWLATRRNADRPRAENGPSRRSQKRAEAEARQARARTRKPLENALRKLEAEIHRLEREKSQIESKLASADFYAQGDQDEVAATLRDQARCAEALEKTEGEWLRVQAELEAIE
jgi:ATP-binding cassette subfamily F protein 3